MLSKQGNKLFRSDFLAKRILAFMTVLAVFMLLVPIASARHKNDKNEPVKILYVPHDNRPISDKQTAAVVAKAESRAAGKNMVMVRAECTAGTGGGYIR